MNERYDPATDTWSVMTPMPTARSAPAHATFGRRIFVMGGEVPQLFDLAFKLGNRLFEVEKVVHSTL